MRKTTAGEKNFTLNKTICVLGLCLSMGAAASAAPAENYDAGKISIDLGTSLSPTLATSPGNSFDAKNDFYGGLTVGLGHNFALQYQYDKTEAKEVNTYFDASGYAEKDNGKVTVNTFNVLYKINPKVSAYIGNRHASGELHSQWGYYDYDGSFTADSVTHVSASKNYVQAGVIGQVELAKNLSGWGNVGIGPDLMTCELGVGYHITSNLTANIAYDYAKYKDIASFGGHDYDITTKGWKAGITLSF